MRSSSQAPASTARPETSGAGAVTVLVLLLLMGGVDCRSAEAFRRAATGRVYVEVVGTPTPRVGVVGRSREVIDPPSSLRDTARGEHPAWSVTDAMLPSPRAPDRDQVV